MCRNSVTSRWMRHLCYRAQQTRTTWKLRIALLTLAGLLLWLTGGWWTVAIADGLVCDPTLAASDAVLIENFDPDYLLFERATRLRTAGLAGRVLVPVVSDDRTGDPSPVALGTAQLMASIARTGRFEAVPIREIEPVTLNAARDVRRYLERERIHSIIVVTPMFRSRRSALVYGDTLEGAGITVHCEPVEGTRGVQTWTRTWHGVEDVLQQWVKLQYYRLYVLPFRANSGSQPGA